jgi:hypothetical protein
MSVDDMRLWVAETKLANTIIKKLLENVRSLVECHAVLNDATKEFLDAVEIDELPDNLQDMRAILEIKLVKLRLVSGVINTNVDEMGHRLKAL